jgi:hypothetical protein
METDEFPEPISVECVLDVGGNEDKNVAIGAMFGLYRTLRRFAIENVSPRPAHTRARLGRV